MLCTLSRWMISRREDTGRELPRFADRHARRCGACRDYSLASASVSSRLRREKSAWLAEALEFPVGLEREERRTAPARSRRSWYALRPLPAAVSLIVLVAAGFVLLRIIPRDSTPSAEDRAAAMAVIKSLSSAPKGLQGVMGEAESSLERERRILEGSVVLAVEYLQARLNIKIERRDPPKSL